MFIFLKCHYFSIILNLCSKKRPSTGICGITKTINRGKNERSSFKKSIFMKSWLWYHHFPSLSYSSALLNYLSPGYLATIYQATERAVQKRWPILHPTLLFISFFFWAHCFFSFCTGSLGIIWPRSVLQYEVNHVRVWLFLINFESIVQRFKPVQNILLPTPSLCKDSHIWVGWLIIGIVAHFGRRISVRYIMGLSS